MKTNWKIEVPQNYFARIAAKEYSDDAGMAVIREFAQNSADAGATRVEFEFLGDSRLVVSDNGRGCDAETVKSRLLTPLGTKKEADAIGGFGKAKELLFFANPRWVISTHDVRVTGSFLSVESFETGCSSWRGFHAEVQLPPMLHQAARNAARNFLRCSERPGVEWYLNGEQVTCYVERSKRAAKDFGFAKAYIDRESNDSTIYLRTGGLLTSTRYGYHGSDVGRVVIEVTGTSSELLTPARDWFRSSAHRSQIEGWLQQLVTNAKQTLADEVGDEIKFADLEEVRPLTEEERKVITLHDVVPNHAGVPAKLDFKSIPVEMLQQQQLTTQQAAGFLAEVDPAGCLNAEEELEGRVMTPARRRADGFDMTLLPVLDGARRLVVHTGGKKQAAVGMRWLKKHAGAALTILAAWATAVRVVASRNGLPVDALGFTFKEGCSAEFVKVNGRFALMINPLVIDLDATDVADDILDLALHEVAHLVTGDGHGEAFVYGEAKLRRKVRGPLNRGAVARALRTGELQSVEEA